MSKGALSPAMRRILLEAVILCTLAFAVGLSLNHQMVMNAFTGKTVAASQVKKTVNKKSTETVVAQAFPDLIELDELDELLATGALLVDARNLDDYRASHLAGAVALPLGEVTARLSDFKLKVSQEQTLILYCNGFGCPDSFDLGVILLKAGYQRVRVFEGGFPQWRDAGRALEGGSE